MTVARSCVAVSEDDDWLYARLQTAVRRALLDVANQFVQAGALAQPSDVFLLPLSLVREVAAGRSPPADARRMAREGQAAFASALQSPPPGEQRLWRTDGTWRGWGTGGRAIGPVRRRDRRTPAPADPRAILVADTLLPTELPLLDAAAFVTETGGPLDHVSAQARERGLPAVVGATGALRGLADGDLVLVDGNQGLVIKLGPGAQR